MNASEFTKGAVQFLEELFKDLDSKSIKLRDHWDIDHVCFRVDSEDAYLQHKQHFSNFSRLLIESEVNGRLISTFKLYEPLNFSGRKIDLVELPAPKKGKFTETGFEHIEVVCDVPFNVLKEELKAFELDVKGLTKVFNQELELCLGKRNVKFHHCSLESVINIEKNERVHKSSMKILNDLKEFGPLIAGTFPLDLQTPQSDVDILLESNNLDGLKKKLSLLYTQYDSFTLNEISVDDLSTLICRFKMEGLPIEIFAQDKAAVLQKAYKHFLIEERLLKDKGEKFKQRVMELRSNGEKTEPAFGKALGIEGNPYDELLKLQLTKI